MSNFNLSELPSPPLDKNGWPWTEGSPPVRDVMPGGEPWPKISIVTPSYNQGRYLEETIRSVLLQGYPNLEYFVIDGGSTDNSIDIIKKYEPWLTYWESEEDRGQSHAINKGFARATGQIMAWLNSDDVYQKGALITIAQTLVGKAKAMLVGASIITDGPFVLSGRLDYRPPTWEEMIYDARSFPQPSVFWTSDLWILSGQLDEQLHLALDYDLWLRMRMHSHTVLFIDEILSYARSHRDQKGRRAQRAGCVSPSVKEKAYVALRAASMRNEHPLIWLLRAWSRRIFSAYHKKNLGQLKGSNFHRIASQLVLAADSNIWKIDLPTRENQGPFA